MASTRRLGRTWSGLILVRRARASLAIALLNTRGGRFVKRVLRPAPKIPRLVEPDTTRLGARQAVPTERFGRTHTRPISNVLLVSHCDFSGNSALHAYKLAVELERRGYSPAIAVPQDPEGIREIGAASFAAMRYDEAADVAFPNGRGADAVHAFSPRELVRLLTIELVRRFDIPYVVHLEDDDAAILAADLRLDDVDVLHQLPVSVLDRLVRPGHTHPVRGRHFLECAAGVTVITPSLREIVPSGVPTRTLHAGFDEELLGPRRSRTEVRQALDLPADTILIAYTGSVHVANLAAMRELYEAVAMLRRRGRSIVLAKTGLDDPEASLLPRLGHGIRKLGRIPRAEVADILHAADILVQPGVPGRFEDFRFPSKVPDFLASGRPVILPRTNIGLDLEDGVEAVLIERGDAQELAHAIEGLADDPELRRRIGERGREFAFTRLRWSDSAELVDDLYREIAQLPHVEAFELVRTPLPTEVAAVLTQKPSPTEARALAEHGIRRFIQFEASGDTPLAVSYSEATDGAEQYVARVRDEIVDALMSQSGAVVVDPGNAWNDGRRGEFLEATRVGIRDGLRLFYVGRGVNLDLESADSLVR